jgi:hypothetical protein
VSRAACAVHPSRLSEGACGECGREVCLACAIPFRGELRCEGCAVRAVGGEVPQRERPRGSLLDRAAAALFAVAILASLLPWDRFGSRTAPLSGWSASPDPWPLLAGVLLLLAGLLAGWAALGRTARRGRVAYVAVGMLAAAATCLALRAPDFSGRNLVPILVLVLALAATGVGLVAVRRTVPSP